MSTIGGIAPMDYAAFTSIPNGTQVKNNYYDQCVAVANLYHQGVLAIPLPSGIFSAHQWWTEFDRQPNLARNYMRSASPAPGAIFVARGGIYNVPDGHIGVVTGVNDDGTFNTIEQNAGTWRHVGRYTRSMGQGLLGFLIPNHNPAGEDMTPEQAAQLDQTFKRLRNMEAAAIVRDKRLVNMEGALIKTLAGVAKITSAGNSAEAAQIAAELEKSLKDDFAAIPKAVNDDAAERLKD